LGFLKTEFYSPGIHSSDGFAGANYDVSTNEVVAS